MQNKASDISALVKHFQKDGNVILLESQKIDHPASSTSYLAAKPQSWIKSCGNNIVISKDGKVERFSANPWDALKEFSKDNKNWLFGYLGYDLKNVTEDLESKNVPLIKAPDMYFMVPGVLIEISKKGELKYLVGSVPNLVESNLIENEIALTNLSEIKRDEYLDKILRAQKHITEGDYYEINLSHPIQFNFAGDPFDLYRKMKAYGPVPFASYVTLDEISICCSSPERFLARTGKKVWSQPIKGTISKIKQNDDDRIYTLLKSEKNKAENLMIVDLVRNDLSRIANIGSVKVRNLFEIQSFETVHQMVSTVECEANEQLTSIDIIKSCFPMGSMTGAPKISAMQAIEELEDYKRGIYSGAIGYIKPNQDFDFNVVIRTAVIERNKLIYPVGGAITSDSVPEEEWEETQIKAKALINSII